jgi:hypothetical protein
MLSERSCMNRLIRSSEIVLQAVLSFWTFDFRMTCAFIHYKFSPLIHLSYMADKKYFKLSHSGTIQLSLELWFVPTKCQKGMVRI